jgi:uncharacterized membrane protein YphA (DoxX/SURF4 family)
MNTGLVIAQVLLGAVFLTTGAVKLTQPRAEMAAGPMRWAADVSDARFRTIGALEVLAVAGLVLAAAFQVPALTTLAAIGLALTMVGAIATHVRYREFDRLVVPVVLLVVSILVAVGAHGL